MKNTKKVFLIVLIITIAVLMVVGTHIYGQRFGLGDENDCIVTGDSVNASSSVGVGGKMTINSCCTISKPGNYLLSQSVYSERKPCFVIKSDNVVLDLNSFTIGGFADLDLSNSRSKDNYYGIYVNGYNNVTVKNGNIMDFGKRYFTGTGIGYFNNINGKIINMNISGNGYGIELENSSKNMLSDNIINSNEGVGINIKKHSDSNTISNNKTTKNANGIQITGSNNNDISGNTFSAPGGEGVSIVGSTNNHVYKNNIINNNYGISLFESPSNNIDSNTVNSNSVYGIYVHGNSNDNILSNNTVKHNIVDFVPARSYSTSTGISIESSMGNKFSGVSESNDLDISCLNSDININMGLKYETIAGCDKWISKVVNSK